METNAGLIRDMAHVERPRQRMMDVGAEAMSQEELLSVVLRTGYKGKGAGIVAQEILAVKSLPELLCMSMSSLSSMRGMGPSRAGAILAMVELVRRMNHAVSVSDMPVIRTMSDITAQAIEIRDKKKEYLLAFFLNARHQLIAKEIISIGTLTASLAHPREVFAPAIGKAAAGVILVHNHPSGDPSPSDEDTRLTKRIAQAGQIMGIDLLDHMIVAENGSYSFKTAGLLP